MNLFHSICESFYKRRVRGSKFRSSFVYFLLSTIHFICIQIFNNCHRKFPKIPLDSAQKDRTSCRNGRAYQSNLASVKVIDRA